MANYGFNPDELIDTKVELIDKDGFHKVGEAGNGGFSSNSNALSGVIVLGAGHDPYNNNNLVGFTIHLKKEDYPELFENNGVPMYVRASAIYSGENYDFSALEVGDENSYVIYNRERPIGETSSDAVLIKTNTFISIVGTFMYDYEYDTESDELGYGGVEMNTVPLMRPCDINKGDIAHVILYISQVVSNEPYDTHIQIDVPWTIDPEDFEE